LPAPCLGVLGIGDLNPEPCPSLHVWRSDTIASSGWLWGPGCAMPRPCTLRLPHSFPDSRWGAQSPSFMDLDGMLLSEVTALIPDNPPECAKWDNDRYLDHCFHVHYDKMLAFACGLHPRLGEGSPVAALADATDCLALISFQFWEPRKNAPGFAERLARSGQPPSAEQPVKVNNITINGPDD